MLESRGAEMADAITRTSNTSNGDAEREVTASVDRLIYYAGWADKYAQIVGNTRRIRDPAFRAQRSDVFDLIHPAYAQCRVIDSAGIGVASCGDTVSRSGLLIR